MKLDQMIEVIEAAQRGETIELEVLDLREQNAALAAIKSTN